MIQAIIGSVTEKKRKRYRKILGMLSLQETMARRLEGLDRRIKERFEYTKNDPEAKLDIKRLKDRRVVNMESSNQSLKDVIINKNEKEKKKKRRLTVTRRLRPPPKLETRDIGTR